MADQQTPQTVEEKMDVIIKHLERMDRRDRARMWMSTLHGLLTLIPILFFIWSTWYLYAHFEEIMGTVMEQTARSVGASTGQSYEEMMRQIREAFGG